MSAWLSSFGTGLPLVIGAKRANPERTVVVLAGGTGFHSSSAELETAAWLGLKMTIIVYENCKAPLIERYQHPGHVWINPWVLQYMRVGFASLTAANGCLGLAAEAPDELWAALKQADDFTLPTVIELPIDYPNNCNNAYTNSFHER